MPEVITLEFGYDAVNDGVYVAEDDVVVWWEQSFDSLSQYLDTSFPRRGEDQLYKIRPWGERDLPEGDPLG